MRLRGEVFTERQFNSNFIHRPTRRSVIREKLTDRNWRKRKIIGENSSVAFSAWRGKEDRSRGFLAQGTIYLMVESGLAENPGVGRRPTPQRWRFRIMWIAEIIELRNFQRLASAKGLEFASRRNFCSSAAAPGNNRTCIRTRHRGWGNNCREGSYRVQDDAIYYREEVDAAVEEYRKEHERGTEDAKPVFCRAHQQRGRGASWAMRERTIAARKLHSSAVIIVDSSWQRESRHQVVRGVLQEQSRIIN